MGYAEIDFSKKLNEEDRNWLLTCGRRDLVEQNDAEHTSKKSSDDKEPPFEQNYSVAPPSFDAGSGAFHAPSPVPPRPTDRQSGIAEVTDTNVASDPTPTVPPLVTEGDGVGDDEDATVEDLTVDQLKEELRIRDLPVGGDKKELQKRLNKALESE